MFSVFLILFSISIRNAYASEECNYQDYLGKQFEYSKIGCPQNKFCNSTRVINVQYIVTPMYYYASMTDEEKKPGGDFQDPVQQLLRRCCGCLKTKKTVLETIADLNYSEVKDADLIYPIFSTASTEKMHGYYYIPLIDIPGMMYASVPPKIDFMNIFYQVFPICVINILLCVVAGFIGWLTETWCNIEEFPRAFLRGWYEGSWWAFVSMTTVGYGDKAPRSFIGRMYSALWITIGIVAYGLLTGIVYTEVSKVNSPPPASMSGKKVGSLLFRDYDAMMIADNGGWAVQNTNLIDTAYESFYADFLFLAYQLEMKKIDGIALDQFTFSHVYWWIGIEQKKHMSSVKHTAGTESENRKWTDDRLMFLKDKTMMVKIPPTTAEPFTYGILVKNHYDYLYLKRAAHDLRYTIRREWNQAFQSIIHFKDEDAKEKFYSARNELYAHTGDYFRNTLITIAVLVVLIGIFGVVYEFVKRGKCGKSGKGGPSEACLTAKPVEALE